MCVEIGDDDSLDIEDGDSKFVRVLKILMWAKKMDSRQLAKILHVRQMQVSRWLEGKSLPSYRALQQFKKNFEWAIDHYFE